MARQIIKMPDIGEGTIEAEIVAWLVKPGDIVDEDDPLAEVMTDKATVEIPAPAAGTIVSISGAVGEKRPVGSELVVLETVREAPPPRTSHHAAVAAIARATPLAPRPPAAVVLPPAAPPAAPASPPPEPAAEAIPPRPAAETPPPSPAAEPVPAAPATAAPAGAAAAPPLLAGAKPLASPAVRKRAWDHGIALQFVAGSGPGGRITQHDLDAFIADGRRPSPAIVMPVLVAPEPARAEAHATAEPVPTAPPATAEAVEDIPITGLRRVIAERLQQSSRQIPHFSYIEEVEIGALEDLRAHLNTRHADRPHLTLLPFLMRAIVNAVVEHPQLNARFDDAAGILHRHRAVHIGVATQTESGLMVPVVHHAETLDLWQAAAEVTRLAEAARTAKAKREELTGSTITITSLGPLGGLAATPVINYPEVAIVGVNRIDERPVVRSGAVVIRRMMNLSSSFDHRIVDGWEAASFIRRVKESLEHPATLFLG